MAFAAAITIPVEAIASLAAIPIRSVAAIRPVLIAAVLVASEPLVGSVAEALLVIPVAAVVLPAIAPFVALSVVRAAFAIFVLPPFVLAPLAVLGLASILMLTPFGLLAALVRAAVVGPHAGLAYPWLLARIAGLRRRLVAQAHVLAALVVGAVLGFLARQRILAKTRMIAIHATVLRLLLHLLLAIGHDDAVVVLRMLEVVLGQHRVARRLSVTCERKVLRRNVGRRAADFHIRAVRLEAAGKGILAPALIVVIVIVVAAVAAVAAAAAAIVVAAAAATMLLSLPHGLPFLKTAVQNLTAGAWHSSLGNLTGKPLAPDGNRPPSTIAPPAVGERQLLYGAIWFTCLFSQAHPTAGHPFDRHCLLGDGVSESGLMAQPRRHRKRIASPSLTRHRTTVIGGLSRI